MGKILNTNDYGIGYDDGVRDTAAQYEATVNRLQMEIETLRAQLAYQGRNNG